MYKFWLIEFTNKNRRHSLAVSPVTKQHFAEDYFFFDLLFPLPAAALLAVTAESLQVAHRGPVMNTEEKKPITIPMMIGRANALIEATPMMNTMPMVSSVVIVVLIERVMVCQILLLAISPYDSFLELRVFSRILSMITIVLLIE